MRCFPFAAVLVAFAAEAQVSGAIEGRVVDAASGGPIGGAAIVIGERAARSDTEGNFRLGGLAPGTYAVDVQAGGYQSFTRENVVVDLDRVLVLPLSMLRPGAGFAMVAPDLPALSAASPEVAAVVTREQGELIPYGRESRSFEQLGAALPGVVTGTVAPGGAGSGIFVDASSLRVPWSDKTRYFVDGLDVSDFGRPRLSQRFIDEVSVIESGFGAESGRTSGALVHAVTRTPGDELHGSVFFEGLPAGGSWVQPGFEAGGAAVRDRVWFYGGLAPESTSSGLVDTQYIAKVIARPAENQLLSVSAFGDPGSGSGSNDLALHYFGAAGQVQLEGTGGWHHARAGGDRIEGGLTGSTNLIGQHHLSAGGDVSVESLAEIKKNFFFAFARDEWEVVRSVFVDGGVRYEGTGGTSLVLPRLGAAWDFSGRGISRLYASWGRYADPLTLTSGAPRLDSAFSAGLDLQLFRDLVASANFLRRLFDETATVSIGKRLSENYLLQISYAISTAEIAHVFKLDLAYAYEWTPRTTVSLGAAIAAAAHPQWDASADLRAMVRYALTPTYGLAVNLDLLDDPGQPVGARAGATLTF